jgi:predicted ester cyclase
MFLTAFPDIHVAVEDIIAEGDKTVARITMSGTHQGAFLGIPPTRKRFSITLIEINRFEDGKSVEHWAETNLLGLLQQLWVIPALAGLLFLAGLATGIGLMLLLKKVLT